jgi:glucose dehydrogenase
MPWLIRSLRIPADETKMGVVLALCAMTMSILSLAIAWQAQVISQQHEAIQWLAKAKFGF